LPGALKLFPGSWGTNKVIKLQIKLGMSMAKSFKVVPRFKEPHKLIKLQHLIKNADVYKRVWFQHRNYAKKLSKLFGIKLKMRLKMVHGQLFTL
jgi:hypothetical protein